MVQGNITADEVYKDRKMLERLGYGIMDVAWGSSGVGFDNIRNFSYVIAQNQDPKLYRRMVFEILGSYFDNALAKEMWGKFIDHKWVISERAGREIDLVTAAKDWFREHGHDFLKDWTFRQEEVPERIRNIGEPRKDLSGLVAGYLFPELRELLDAGFSVTDIAIAAVKSKTRLFRKSTKKLHSRFLRCLPETPSHHKRNSLHSGEVSTIATESEWQDNKPFLFVKKLRPSDRDRCYIQLVADLTGHPINTNEKAEKQWSEILEHKWFMSERKGRDVGIRAAAVDYYRRLNLLQAAEQGQES
ncbi:MAG: hypothetical protein JWP00_3798 [Chloroflexi bacterium]|jgi:hypothetical protein|nr:hypothetical protein [Chloroflexota bacterium]